jgi:hypothetical protein
VRNLDATLKSRANIDSLRFRTESGARNSIVYGLGLTFWAVQEYRLSHSFVQFPGFLNDPKALFVSLRFPGPVSLETFTDALQRIRRPDLVHDSR